MKKKALLLFLLIGAVSMIVMSIHYFQSNQTGILRGKEIASKFWYLILLRIHIFLGLIAISIGPFQFSNGIRKKFIKVHKVLGYTYVVAVLVSSICGIIVAQFAKGGITAASGFSLLVLLWFSITVKAVLAIRRGDIKTHKKWVFYSYGLTFAAITQRTLLLVPLLTDVSFMPIYQLSAWLPWMVNLGIAYLLLKITSN